MLRRLIQTPLSIYIALAVLFIGVQIITLIILGQPFLCSCGLKLWEGAVYSIGNSQQITDWYTFSHIIHGFIFYLFFWILFPRMAAPQRLLLAIGLEIGWEILENTPWVINLYREQALAQGYMGDSIINSVSDTLAMITGFVLAWRLPVRVTVTLALIMEIFTGYFIRDGLTLNIINFIHHFEFIENWQGRIE
ncbi:MAG: DUF2585 family protein [Candidatus Vogelbacteria bacterium]|nr:DUF2585 family protein [Candidatus Vogelbacteria bacterium]